MYLNGVATANVAATSVSYRTPTPQINGPYYRPASQPTAGTNSSSIRTGVGSTLSSTKLHNSAALTNSTYAGLPITRPTFKPSLSPAEPGSSASFVSYLTDNSTGAPAFQAPKLYNLPPPKGPTISASATTSFPPSLASGRRSPTFSWPMLSVQSGNVNVPTTLDDTLSTVSYGRHTNRAGQPGTGGSEHNSVHPSSTSPGSSFSGSADISLHSSPGSSTFRIRKATFTPAWTWTVPPRVLLVDDDLVSRKLFSKFLQVSGCTVDVAVDGIGAVNKTNLEKYDLVFMDIVMPKLDGISATSLIRHFDRMTPIIAMTSNSKPHDVVGYYSSGMNDILSKPFTREGLFNMLEKHLRHLKQPNAEATASTLVPVPTVAPDPPLPQPVNASLLGSFGRLTLPPLKRDLTPVRTVSPRILLVDDDEVSRKLFSKFLQVSGCTIDIAVDGIRAVNKLNLEKYDLVFMDIVMPRLDGVSATSLIRQFDKLTPIIAMTSNSKP